MIATIYDKLERAEYLNFDDLKTLVAAIRSGSVDSHRFVAILAIMETRNRIRGIDFDETAYFIKALRHEALPDLDGVVCTAGTGGDPVKTINISTAASLVLAASGLPVLKNGYKSVTGRCGSRDILKAWGVNPFAPLEQVLSSVKNIGIGYYDFKNLIVHEERSGFHSPLHYIGALSHPVRVAHKVLGCSDERHFNVVVNLAEKLFDNYLLSLNPDIDEISTVNETLIVEKRAGHVRRYTFDPTTLGLTYSSYRGVTALCTPRENADFLTEVLGGREGAAFDLIALNAAAALYISGVCSSIRDGFSIASDTLKSRAALTVLNKWVTE